ncbi:hypothetical protein, partial [Escherichia coli]|uniref:hypothetical protein n=1 Tax=Escherichia coli TaxID=562 RepID=UPI001BDDACD7
VPAYGPQNDVTLKMPAFEWVHVQLHQQKGMISLSPPTICNSAVFRTEDNNLNSFIFERINLCFYFVPESLEVRSVEETFESCSRFTI